MAVSLLDLQAVIAQLRGGDPGRWRRCASWSASVTGRPWPRRRWTDRPGGCGRRRAGRRAVQEFLLTRCLSIAGGTTQILLSVIGERLLGLPREEAR